MSHELISLSSLSIGQRTHLSQEAGQPDIMAGYEFRCWVLMPRAAKARGQLPSDHTSLCGAIVKVIVFAHGIMILFWDHSTKIATVLTVTCIAKPTPFSSHIIVVFFTCASCPLERILKSLQKQLIFNFDVQIIVLPNPQNVIAKRNQVMPLNERSKHPKPGTSLATRVSSGVPTYYRVQHYS